MKDFRKSMDKEPGFVERLALTQDIEEAGLVNSNMAHDFNNILATIMGYTELLQEILANDENGSIQKYLNEIYICARRAYDLVDNSSKHGNSCDNKSHSD